MMPNIVTSASAPPQAMGKPVRLSGYSWPPDKLNFRFREIAFHDGKWRVSFFHRGNPVSLTLDSAAGSGKFATMRPAAVPISFEKVQGGWLGRASVKSYLPAGQSLLLVFLSDHGKGNAGLWSPEQGKFFSLDFAGFARKPDFLPVQSEVRASSISDFPHPFDRHGENFAFLRTLGDPLRRDWGKLDCRVVSTGSGLAWKVRRRGGAGTDELFLPYDAKDGKPPQGVQGKGSFFSNWSREAGKWVSAQPVPAGAEGAGIVSQAALRLALYDNGCAVLTLEEEKPDGGREIHRIHPEWLANPKEKPLVISSRKLSPGEKFEDISFVNQAIRDDFGLSDSRFQPSVDRKMLGGVMV